MICQEPGAIIQKGFNPIIKPANNFSSTVVPSNDLALLPNVTVTASSFSPGSPASAAIDGKIGGWTESESLSVVFDNEGN